MTSRSKNFGHFPKLVALSQIIAVMVLLGHQGMRYAHVVPRPGGGWYDIGVLARTGITRTFTVRTLL